jgi:uncharacterized protein (TIGR02611 family)
MKLTYLLIRSNPTGRVALKVLVGALGGLVVLLGLLLIPLPGPGWLIVFFGLGILAVEFAWARTLLHFTRNRLRGWTSWVTRQTWPIRLLIGVLGLLFVGAVVVLTLRLSFGVNVLTRGWAYVTTL